MATTVKTDFADRPIATGSVESPTTIVRRWNGVLRLWWIDYCMREGLRTADDHVIYEAGCRRTESGRVVPLNHR